MDDLPPEGITTLLHAWGTGKNGALENLIPLIHDELRCLARRFMQRERPGHTLQTTALVNEAYIRLRRTRDIQWCDRVHFLAVSARIMRRILVDLARSKRDRARRETECQIKLGEHAIISRERFVELLAVDEALDRLATLNARQSQVVELRYFAGLSEIEISGVLKVSERTVRHDWNLARAWLYRELSHGGAARDA